MSLEQIDLLERDEKKDIFRLLGVLDERQRIAFLHWACGKAGEGRKHRPCVANTLGTQRDVWGDLMGLSFSFDLDLQIALAELIQRVRAIGR